MKGEERMRITDFVLIFVVYLLVSVGAYFLNTRREVRIELPTETLEQILEVPMNIPEKKTA